MPPEPLRGGGKAKSPFCELTEVVEGAGEGTGLDDALGGLLDVAAVMVVKRRGGACEEGRCRWAFTRTRGVRVEAGEGAPKG